MNVLSLFTAIKYFVLDVDGVLTNSQLLLLENGEMARSMNIKDGYAMQLAIKKGYEIIVISGAESAAVRMRLNKLGVGKVYQGVTEKAALLKQLLPAATVPNSQILYMGDDMPDLEIMQLAGLPCCPKDAVAEIKQQAKYISPFEGGTGCVRDVIEKVLKLNGDWLSNNNIAAI